MTVVSFATTCVVGTASTRSANATAALVPEVAYQVSSPNRRVRGVLLAGEHPRDVPTLQAGLRDLIEQEAPDVVHTTSLLAGLAAAASLPAGMPWLHSPLGRVTPHRGAGSADDDVAARLCRLEALLLREVSRVVAVSPSEQALLVDVGVPRQRIAVIPYPVDETHFRPDGPVAGRPGDRRRVVCVTDDLTAAGGAPAVVAAMRAVADAELLIVGGPPATSLAADAAARCLADLAQRLKVRLRLTGGVPHDDLPALLRSADVVVAPPRWDGTGAASVEAMACGRAVVAPAVGGDADAVVERTTGVLVALDDPEGLRRALRELIDDDMTRTGYGMAGVARVQGRHSWSVVGPALGELYDAVGAGRPSWDGHGPSLDGHGPTGSEHQPEVSEHARIGG